MRNVVIAGLSRAIGGATECCADPYTSERQARLPTFRPAVSHAASTKSSSLTAVILAGVGYACNIVMNCALRLVRQ